MALKFQYNKISMQFLRKQLRIRIQALPVLKSKETALRLTVKKEKEILKNLIDKYNTMFNNVRENIRLWCEFPEDIFKLKEVLLNIKKIAGVKAPLLEKCSYEISNFSRFENPLWLTKGIIILKDLTEILTEIEVEKKKIEILEYARKKTTQKVNLYEKVQIPEYSEAILKIKRYLEDVDNLEKAAQKLTKQSQYEKEKSVY